MSPRLEIRALEKRWTPESGLPPVTFDVRAGQLVVVRGRSGSGKSTLLAIIAGLCSADSGSFLVDGASAARVAPWQQIALVPQVLALAPELTVRENITDGIADPKGVDALIEQVHLEHVAARTPDTCSMGEQQRTALARAVLVQPMVLLADEPTSHQDAAHRDMVVAALRSAAEAGGAVLVVSHDATLWHVADQVITLGEELGGDELG
jgi:ABC-type lipoprotein export system ATPase subunit